MRLYERRGGKRKETRGERKRYADSCARQTCAHQVHSLCAAGFHTYRNSRGEKNKKKYTKLLGSFSFPCQEHVSRVCSQTLDRGLDKKHISSSVYLLRLILSIFLSSCFNLSYYNLSPVHFRLSLGLWPIKVPPGLSAHLLPGPHQVLFRQILILVPMRNTR